MGSFLGMRHALPWLPHYLPLVSGRIVLPAVAKESVKVYICFGHHDVAGYLRCGRPVRPVADVG